MEKKDRLVQATVYTLLTIPLGLSLGVWLFETVNGRTGQRKEIIAFIIAVISIAPILLYRRYRMRKEGSEVFRDQTNECHRRDKVFDLVDLWWILVLVVSIAIIVIYIIVKYIHV